MFADLLPPCPRATAHAQQELSNQDCPLQVQSIFVEFWTSLLDLRGKALHSKLRLPLTASLGQCCVEQEGVMFEMGEHLSLPVENQR